MLTCKIGYGILYEIKELELNYMEHDYMRIKRHKRGLGTSRNLKVMAKSRMKLFDMVIIVKRNFMSLGICLFPHSFINVDFYSEY